MARAKRTMASAVQTHAVQAKAAEVKAAVETKAEEVKAAVETKAAEAKAVMETKAAEAKAAVETKAAEVKTAVQAKAQPEVEKSVVVEFGGKQVVAKDVMAQAEKAYLEANPGTVIKSMELYISPEQNAAYYVVNGQGSENFKIQL